MKQNDPQWSKGLEACRHPGIPRTPDLLLLIKEREGKRKKKKKDSDWQPGGGRFLQDFLSLADFLPARQPPEPWRLPLDGAQPSPWSPADQNAVLYVNIYTCQKKNQNQKNFLKMLYMYGFILKANSRHVPCPRLHRPAGHGADPRRAAVTGPHHL